MTLIQVEGAREFRLEGFLVNAEFCTDMSFDRLVSNTEAAKLTTKDPVDKMRDKLDGSGLSRMRATMDKRKKREKHISSEEVQTFPEDLYDPEDIAV